MLSYRAILKQSIKITWKNKFLWFFGFFASLISFSAEFKIIFRSITQDYGIKTLTNIKMFLDTGIFSVNSWHNMLNLFRNDPKSIMLIITVFLLIIAITIFFAWLSTVSQIGIIDSVNKIINGKKEKITIKKEIIKANKKFWPVFLMNIIISLIINLIYLLIGFLLILVIIKNQAITTILYGFIFIIFIPISLFLSFVIKYAIAYLIIENKKFFNSIKQGWRLFINNWLISVEMTIVLFFINILAIILISVISFIIFFIFFSLALSSVFIISSGFLFWTILTLGALIVLIFMVLGGSILNSFQISSWTDLFIQLRREKHSSRLENIFIKKD